jgi:hypothetical protein
MSTSQVNLTFKGTADFQQAQKEMRDLRSAYDKSLTDIKNIVKDFAISTAKDFGLTARDLAGMTAAAGVAVGGFTLLAGAAVGVGTEVFNLAKYAADTSDRLYELSQKTGFSVETLSALDALAKESGTTLEAITQSLTYFNRAQESAAEGNKKHAAAFRQLHIDVNDADKAFEQAFDRLSSLANAHQRAAEAAKLFGPRGGTEMLKLIKESNGDLETFMQKLAAMGLLITGDTARAGHKFAEDYRLVEMQLAAIRREIGEELMPTVKDALESTSAWLRDNRGEIKEWAGFVRDAADGVRSLVGYINDIPGAADAVLNNLTPLIPILRLIKDLHDYVKPPLSGGDGTPAETFRDNKFIMGGGFGIPTGGLLGVPDFSKLAQRPTAPREPFTEGGGDHKGRDTSQQELNERLRVEDAILKATEASLQRQVEDNDRAYKLKTASLDAYTKTAIDLENKRWQATRETLLKEIEDVSKHGKDKEGKAQQLNARLSEEEHKSAKKIQDLRDEQRAKEQAAQREYEQGIADIQDKAGEQRIARIRDQVDRRVKLESDAEKEIGRIQLEAIDRRVALLLKDQNAAGVNAEEKKKIGIELGKLEVERGALVEQTGFRVAAAQRAELRAWREFNDELKQLYNENQNDLIALRRAQVEIDSRHVVFARGTAAELRKVERDAENERHRQALEEIERRRKEMEDQAQDWEEFFEIEQMMNKRRENEERRHKQSMSEIDDEESGGGGPFGSLMKWANDTKSLSQFVSESVVGMKDAVVGGLGEMAQAYIETGETSVQALRKAVAGQIAEIAKQAIVEGSKQEVLAIASLAEWDLRGFALHQLAAAGWFALAGGSMWAGRKVAGNAFGAGSGASAGATSSAATSEPTPKNATYTYSAASSPSSQTAGSASASVAASVGNIFRDDRNRMEEIARQMQQQSADLHEENRQMVAALKSSIDKNTRALSGWEAVNPDDLMLKTLNKGRPDVDASVAESHYRHAASSGDYVDRSARLLRVP